VSLIFDAAHALGARVGDRAVGALGIAEVFSFTPSKMVSCGEGGAVATADMRLADEIAAGRNYGRSRSGDWTGRGLSARMGEIPALMARAGIDRIDEEIARRARLATAYREGLAAVPGLRFQTALRGTVPVHRDVSMRVDRAEFGLDRDALRAVLAMEGVETGTFFYPAITDLPLSRRFMPQTAEASGQRPLFPIARAVASEVVNLPIGTGVEPSTVSEIAALIAQVHAEAPRLAIRFRTPSAPRPPSPSLP
jgi:dTDP-4-amino-4,6-dideoxygalactose transaminase